MQTSNSLDIQDYLDASSDASKRTRTMTIVLVVASVIVLAGLLNSLQSHWMLRRLIMLGNIHGAYTKSKLGPYPDRANYLDDITYNEAAELYRQRYKDLSAAVSRAYVDNSLVIKVPFFGFTFDVNDLGILGGVGFLIILGCYRFCISRELDNLRLSFEEAKRLNKVDEFYNLLAMRQVFTVPQTRYIQRTKFLDITPKLICWLPLLLHLAVMGNDIWTGWIGEELHSFRYKVSIISQGLIALFLIFLSLSITVRLVRIDWEWDRHSNRGSWK